MTNLYKIIHEAILSLKEYREISKKDLKVLDYRALCDDAAGLLVLLGEEKTTRKDLKGNGKDMRYFIAALKILKSQREKGDKDIIKRAYLESLKYESNVMKDLLQIYNHRG